MRGSFFPIALILAVFASPPAGARRKPPPPTGEILLDIDHPIVEARINGVPFRLRVGLEQKGITVTGAKTPKCARRMEGLFGGFCTCHRNSNETTTTTASTAPSPGGDIISESGGAIISETRGGFVGIGSPAPPIAKR